MTLLKTAAATIALLLAAAAPVSTPAPAPAIRDADPAMWVVRDADTTIYLFGTIHVLRPGLSWFDEAVRSAFEASDSLVIEMVAPPPAEMAALVQRIGFTAGGPTLTEQLPAADRPRYVAALAEGGLPATAFDRAKPWVAAINLTLLPLLRLGYDPSQGPEQVLTAAAAAGHKPVTGLETAAQQLGYFDALPQDVQLRFLSATLDDLPNTQRDMQAMVDEWAAGDPEALARTMNEGIADAPELARVLLTERNRRWAAWVAERLHRPGTVFVAVGAGHLAGRESVLAQLRAIGVRAQRVRY